MKNFSGKRLIALLSALIMLTAALPAALAEVEDHAHVWDAGEITKQPTCSEGGTRVYHCTVAGCNIIRTEALEKVAHRYEASQTESVPATCKAGGKTVYRCAFCNAKMEQEIAKLPHAYDEANAKIVASTCTVAGTKSYTCTICGDTVTEALPLAEHKVGADGRCTVCGKQIETVEVVKSADITLSTALSADVLIGTTLRSNLYSAFRAAHGTTLRAVTFGTPTGVSCGTLYANEKRDAISTREYTYATGTDYPLSALYFVSTAKTGSYKIPYTATDDKNALTGTITITVSNTSDMNGSLLLYTVQPGGTVTLNRDDFFRLSKSVNYVAFSFDQPFAAAEGTLYSRYGTDGAQIMDAEALKTSVFYYSAASASRLRITDLTFVAARGFTGSVTLSFLLYTSSGKVITGSVVFEAEEPIAQGADQKAMNADVILSSAGGDLQLNANDFARYFSRTYPNDTLSYVKFGDVPDKGALYYNYYSNSAYGSEKILMAKANCADTPFYFSPAGTQFALSALTYVPDGANYCVTLPFTAFGGEGKSVSGTVLVSVTKSAVSEVYGAVPKGSSVPLPSGSIVSAISAATGKGLAGIRFITLPDEAKGTTYLGAGTDTKAAAGTLYSYTGDTVYLMSSLRFQSAENFTGSVEFPYVAYDADGNAIAVGKFCLGILEQQKKFSDLTSSVWCYKYVTELASSGVIDGYADGTYKQQNTITYGAALKLILLAAGYGEQAPVDGGGVFSGYLALAKKEGFVTGTPNLSGTITRGQVAQIAARAMKLSIEGLSAQKPFNDTADVYIQALNAAGIVEGYFENGVSSFRPNNTLTRGHVSAIVWRMYNYGKN